MKQIDFLPARYRDEQTQRKKHFWRVVVVTIFAGLLCVAAFGLYQRRRGIERELETARQRHELVMAQVQQLAAVQAELAALRSQADLVVFLRHPWPKSRILATALAALPPSITLDSIEVLRERPPSAAAHFTRGRPSPASASGSQEETQLSPAEQDLQTLHEELDPTEIVVLLTGATRDSLALHAWLAELASSDLFAEAKLLEMESAQGAADGEFHFSARLATLRGYGDPNTPLAAAASLRLADAADPTRGPMP